MILPDFPITASMASPELQAEGVRLLRELIRDLYPEWAEVISDEEIWNELKNFDLRLLMGQDNGKPEC